MKNRIRSYFDVKTRELRESDPEGIRIIRLGPPFEAMLYDVKRLNHKRCLTLRFDLRKYFAKDKDELHKNLKHEVFAMACKIFDGEPVGGTEELAAARLLCELGADWALQVAGFPPPLHARLLFLADRVPRFRQIVLTCPGLAVDALRCAVESCGSQLRGAVEYLTPLLDGNTRQVAAKLGWPAGTVGILQRLWPPAATFKALGLVKSRLTSDDAVARRARRVLPHCSFITTDVVNLLGNAEAWERVKNNFLVESCGRRPDPFQNATGDWTMLSQLLHAEARFPRMRVPRIETTRQLQRLYERYFTALNPRDVDALLGAEFPDPPFESDDPKFQHVEDALAALAEAAEMGPSCLPQLIPSVTVGTFCIFRVMPDQRRGIERATLVICQRPAEGGGVNWAIYDARTRFNQPISKTTEKAIKRFLRRHDPQGLPCEVGENEGRLFQQLLIDDGPF